MLIEKKKILISDSADIINDSYFFRYIFLITKSDFKKNKDILKTILNYITISFHYVNPCNIRIYKGSSNIQ